MMDRSFVFGVILMLKDIWKKLQRNKEQTNNYCNFKRESSNQSRNSKRDRKRRNNVCFGSHLAEVHIDQMKIKD